MGFGCNVPAVISTRACCACSRDTCISAIAFRSACSYQMGATLAVYAAAQKEWLVIPYLLYLTATTLIYTRLHSTPLARSSSNVLVSYNDVFIQAPTFSAIWRESRITLVHFLKRAMPIFFAITLVASLLDWCGAIPVFTSWLEPTISIFNLPPESLLAVIMASIRKDGILLLGESSTLAALTGAQLLTATYLAGTILPCLVTSMTIASEKSVGFVGRLLVRQMSAAILFTLILAWSAAALGRLGW